MTCRLNIVGWLTLTLLLALTCASVRAHDPLDITAQARLLPGGIELRLTLAWSTASRLLADGPAGAVIRPEQFDEIRPALELRAPAFLPVSANGKTLAPKSVATELSRDGDVKILLLFPAVAATRFRFDAALLKALPEGGTVFLLARGPGADPFVHERMTLEKPACEIAAFPL